MHVYRRGPTLILDEKRRNHRRKKSRQDQIEEGEIDMYADDTCNTILHRPASVDTVCDGLNCILGDVHNWCRNNKLTIHSGKSEAMVINSNSIIGPLKPVSFGNKILSYVNTSICLGVVIDSKLS